MDSIISLGQKNTLAEYMILSGADNRPPMLDKDLYDSWKIRMELYMQNREIKKYAELSAAEKIQADCDMKATNIILQGLPADIYSLVNHHRVAKDLWERVQLLMQGTSLTKQERECFAIPIFSSGYDPIACLNNAMAFLTAVASLRFPFTNNQLQNSSNPRTKPLFRCQLPMQQAIYRQSDQGSAWYKEKAMLAEAQEAGQILDEEQLAFLADPGILTDQAQTITPHNAAFQTEDLDTYDSDCDDLSTAEAVLMANISIYGSNIISDVPNSETYLNDMDNQKTLILEEESRSKMSEKAKDPEVIAKKISHKPIDYEKLNSLTDDFEKCFSPQQELSAEQAFWFHILNPSIESSYTPPVIVEVPSELPKVSLVNASLKKLKFHLTQFDSVVKKRTTPNALEEETKEENVNPDKCDLEPINKELENSVAKLLSKNAHLCNEINHVKQVFKDQFDLIKKTRVRHKEQSDSLINKLNLKSVEIEDLKAQIQDKVFVITSLKNDLRKLKGKEIVENVVHIPSANTIAPGMFKLDLEPLPPRLLQNREVHITYLRNTQEQANILREIVEQAKAKQPLDSELDLACKYATRIQELLVYVQDTCPNAIIPSAKKVTVKPMNNVKKVRFVEPLTSSSNIKQVESSNTSDSNTHVLSSTGVKCSTSNCGSKPPGNKRNDRISQSPSRNKKNKVEAQPRKVNKVNRVVKPVCDVDVKHSLSKANSEILCATCNKSMFDGVHDKCLLDLVQNGNNHTKSAKKHRKQNVWKPTGHVFTEVGFKWKPTGRTFTIVGNSCPLTRFTSTNAVQIVLWYLDFRCSKHMTGNRSQLMNFVSKFLGTVRFGNDQIARIMGYGDYQLGNVIISRVYYVEGFGHNLFSVGQFCDADLEVVFRKNTCVIRNLEGVDLLSGSRDTNLYTISLDDMLKSSPICLLSKASKTKSWLWHRRLSHLNFGTLNKLAKDGLARGIPKIKFQKYHLCSACALGKSRKSSHYPKAEDTNQKKLYLLHMDLCGPMRVASINGKMYILVIVEDYSRFTWVRFLKTKDEAPAAIIKCIKNIQVRLKATVRNVRTDNGTEFVNQTLREWYENVGIMHQTSVARTPQQNGVVERRNRTLVEVARTMLIFSKVPLFLIAMASEQISSGPGLQGTTPATSIPEAAAQRAEVLADSPVSTSIDQYASSTSIPSSQEHEHYLIISQGFEESPKTPTFHDDPLNESPHKDLTSQ
ncbi:retrovirus-related pol polyprotein from transposon TNT 1-94 [Tanacetum coccineum]